MIDVMRPIASTAAIQTPALINTADTQLSPAGSPPGFSISDFLTRIFRNFSATLEVCY